MKKFEELKGDRARFLMLDEFFEAAGIRKLGEILDSVRCGGKLKSLD